MRNAVSLVRAAATFWSPRDALLLSLADPGGNSIRRSDPDRTDAVDLGRDATWLGLARATRAGFFFGARLALDRLVTILRGAAGGSGATPGGAGGGRTALRTICFGFGAVDTGGKGGGSTAFGGMGLVVSADGATLRGRAAAVLGGGGAMVAGAFPIEGGGGATARGILVTGGGFLIGLIGSR